MTERRVLIIIDSWEIECCAPPPVVGEPAAWRVLFVPSDTHPLSAEHRWTVVPHDPTPRLERDGVVAGWGAAHVRTPPSPGEHLLRGFLSGTGHVFPADLPPVTGRVHRIQVISHELGPDPDGGSTPVWLPHTFGARDVDASPRWFTRPGSALAHAPEPTDTALRFVMTSPGAGRYETGIAVDLLVAA